MNDRILEILENLIKHNINKHEAQIQLLYLYSVIDNKNSIKDALNSSVKAIYFSDSSDYKKYHYEVIYNLTGLNSDEEINIPYLFKELNPE